MSDGISNARREERASKEFVDACAKMGEACEPFFDPMFGWTNAYAFSMLCDALAPYGLVVSLRKP